MTPLNSKKKPWKIWKTLKKCGKSGQVWKSVETSLPFGCYLSVFSLIIVSCSCSCSSQGWWRKFRNSDSCSAFGLELKESTHILSGRWTFSFCSYATPLIERSGGGGGQRFMNKCLRPAPNTNTKAGQAIIQPIGKQIKQAVLSLAKNCQIFMDRILKLAEGAVVHPAAQRI